jgi:2-amino-4-hydroxy-6-hydroxymethyldihydropteridine diphosphokinase
VALSLGGNVDHSERLFRRAISGLRGHVSDLEIAPLYRTRAVSPIPQPDFLNTALLGHADLEPEDLLAVLKALERAAGRERTERHGPRPLDIDLLLYGSRCLWRPEITIPHPGLRNRRFYLEPLAAIAPNLRVPPDEVTIATLLADLQDPSDVCRIEWFIPR